MERNQQMERDRTRWFRRLGGSANGLTLFCPQGIDGQKMEQGGGPVEEQLGRPSNGL